MVALLLTLLIPLLLLTDHLPAGEEDRCFVESREVVRGIYGSGYVRGRKQVIVRPAVSGYVSELKVREGDSVRKGQVIARIDTGGLENRLRSLRERLALVEERLREGSDFRKSLEGNVAVRRENLEKARRRYLRRKELFRKGVIPEESLEEAERLFRIAEEEYRSALSTLRDRLRELSTERKALLEEIASLRREIERYTVRSPLSGVVLRVFVEEGDYVNPLRADSAIASVSTRERKVVLNVDEEYLPLVRRGQKVYVVTDAYPGRVFEGEVSAYALQSDAGRRVVDVEVRVDLPQEVPVDSVVEANILVERLKTTVVPARAVKDGYVTLLVNGEKRRVKVGRIFRGFAEVLGFPAGTPCLIED